MRLRVCACVRVCVHVRVFMCVCAHLQGPIVGAHTQLILKRDEQPIVAAEPVRFPQNLVDAGLEHARHHLMQQQPPDCTVVLLVRVHLDRQM